MTLGASHASLARFDPLLDGGHVAGQEHPTLDNVDADADVELLTGFEQTAIEIDADGHVVNRGAHRALLGDDDTGGGDAADQGTGAARQSKGGGGESEGEGQAAVAALDQDHGGGTPVRERSGHGRHASLEMHGQPPW